MYLILFHRVFRRCSFYDFSCFFRFFGEIHRFSHVKVSNTLEEACELIEAGFEYVTDIEDKMIFRKRK